MSEEASDSEEPIRELIPCEICDQQVDFDTYLDHVRECRGRRTNATREPPRVAMMVRDESGAVYRLFIEDALRALQGMNIDARTTNLIQQSIVSLDAQHNAANVTYDNQVTSETNEENGDRDIDDDQTEERDLHEDDDVALPGEHLDDERSSMFYQRTPVTHRSIVIIPRLFTGPFEDVSSDELYEWNTLVGEVIGHVKVGVKDVNAVVQHIDACRPDEVCPICQESLSSEELKNQCVKTLCNHNYCMPCISKWLAENKKCPICQTDLEDALAQKSE